MTKKHKGAFPQLQGGEHTEYQLFFANPSLSPPQAGHVSVLVVFGTLLPKRGETVRSGWTSTVHKTG